MFTSLVGNYRPRYMPRYAHLIFSLCLLVLVGAPSLEAQERQQRPPFTLEQLIQLVESDVFPDERIVFLANQSCLGFRLDEAAVARLRAANATERLIASLRGACVRMLTTVVVTPSEIELEVGANRILRAQALDQDSAHIANVIFEWASGDTTIAEVSGGGVVLGLAPGETRVTARIQAGPAGSALVRVVEAAEAPTEEDSLALQLEGGKSVATAAALGVLIPGGGEFYVGNTVKGVVVLAGAAGALAAGYLITTEDTLDVTRTTQQEDCDTPNTCINQTETTAEAEQTRSVVIGAAVAGAFWLYGLIDGIRSAKKYRPEQPLGEQQDQQGISLELAPPDGVRFRANGDVDLTIVRVRL